MIVQAEREEITRHRVPIAAKSSQEPRHREVGSGKTDLIGVVLLYGVLFGLAAWNVIRIGLHFGK
jgi:hypothetical protein